DRAEKDRNELVGWRSELGLSTVALLLVIVLFVVSSTVIKHWPEYVPRHFAKVTFLTFIGLLVGLVAASGVWLAHGRLKQVAKERNLLGPRVLNRFLGLQSEVHRFLGTLGAILGLLILATGAQRRTV